MNRKVQTANRWMMSALVIGLSALVLVTLAAPSGVAAADIAFLASEPKLAGIHCVDAGVAETELDGNDGTLSDCRAEYQAANPELMAAWRYIGSALEPTGSDRNYGTFAGIWGEQVEAAGGANRESATSNRAYGTFSGAWTGYIDRADPLNPELTEMDRDYGTFAGVWTGYMERVAAENGAGVSFLAANPELMAAHRYIGSAEQVTDVAFLAANPELMAARRY